MKAGAVRPGGLAPWESCVDGPGRFGRKIANCDALNSWPGEGFHGQKESSHPFSHLQEGKRNWLDRVV